MPFEKKHPRQKYCQEHSSRYAAVRRARAAEKAADPAAYKKKWQGINFRNALWTWHRLRPEEYEEMLEGQGGGCAICGSEETRGSADMAGIRQLCIDHKHGKCGHPTDKHTCEGCRRGLLCAACNQAIGHMKDDPERLEAAAAYLRRFA